MADIPISDLVDATTVTSSDELPIVQSGVTKRATVAELSAAITPADASTSTKGIARLATDADVAGGLVPDEIVTPASLRYGLANGVAEEIVLDGATGSTSAGDINIPGNYYINGAELSTTPLFTPVAFSAASEIIMITDFSVYSNYEIWVHYSATPTFGASAVLPEFSQDNGSSYVGFTFGGFNGATAFSGQANMQAPMGSGAIIMISLAQISTTGSIAGAWSCVDPANRGSGVMYAGSSADVDRIKVRDSAGGTITGSYVVIPKNKR